MSSLESVWSSHSKIKRAKVGVSKSLKYVTNNIVFQYTLILKYMYIILKYMYKLYNQFSVRNLSYNIHRDLITKCNLCLKGTGQGVHAYIIDTGIYPDNTYFERRAKVAFDAIGDGQRVCQRDSSY